MDIRELKTLLKNSTSVLILDNGEPAFVLVDYQVYRSIAAQDERNSAVPISSSASQNTSNLSAQELEAIERLNKEILALRNQIEMEERAAAERQQ